MTSNRHKPTGHSRPALRVRLCAMLAAMAAMLLWACDHTRHSGYAAVPPDGWLYGDTLTVLPAGADSAGTVRADIAVALRHSNAYAYSNIWLALTYSGPDSTVTDTLNITLADNFGNWQGQGMGISYQKLDTVMRDVTVDLSRPVKINHIMRADTLNGIEQVGVVIIDKTSEQ